VAKADVLRHLTALCGAVDLPVNADFESGFAADPEGIWENVLLAIKTGIAGLSLEDTRLDGQGLYGLRASVDRIKAARAAIDASGLDVILVARTEILLADAAALHPAIDKLVAFADAGADCLYAPGVKRKEDIAALVRAVAPKPVNVLMSAPGLSVAELADLGVRRISVGGALARVAWAAMLSAAEEIKAGSFHGLGQAASGKRLNDIFRSLSPDKE
jgi:2-methylisocitrate lyase-like PEP mutase family enzyme